LSQLFCWSVSRITPKVKKEFVGMVPLRCLVAENTFLNYVGYSYAQ